MTNETIVLAAVGILNLANTIVTGLKRIQVGRDLISELTEQNKAKDELIKMMRSEIKTWKRQYDMKQSQFKELEGRYKEITCIEYRTPSQSLLESEVQNGDHQTIQG